MQPAALCHTGAMKKPNSSLNIFVTCTAVSLIAGLLYGGWGQISDAFDYLIGKWHHDSYWPRNADGSFVSSDVINQQAKKPKDSLK